MKLNSSNMEIDETKIKLFLERIKNKADRVFVISDTHFFHYNMLVYEPQRQIYAETHNSFEEFVVERWNDTVFDNDWVIHLGDFIMHRLIDFFQQYKLRGKKILIEGNHDAKRRYGALIKENFDIVIDGGNLIILDSKQNVNIVPTNNRRTNGMIVDVEKIRILFSHYPIYQYDEYDKTRIDILNKFYREYNCNLNIHGHVHFKDEVHYELCNVSVEKIDFTPKSILSILESYKSLLLSFH